MSYVLALAVSVWMAVQGIQIPPPPRGFSPTEADMVVDAASVISADAVARMNRIIFDVKRKSGGEIVVVTLPDIGQRDVADVALGIARDWKVGSNADVGDRARNAGILILVVPKETSSDGRGHISIMTGQGSEGFITDATAGDIRREATPYLVRQDYSSAMELLTLRVAQRFAGEFGFDLDTALVPQGFTEQPARRRGEVPPQALLIVFLILLFVFSTMARASRGGRGRGCLTALLVADSMSRRGRGGWGGGFGGGGFSGGGSSGSW